MLLYSAEEEFQSLIRGVEAKLKNIRGQISTFMIVSFNISGFDYQNMRDNERTLLFGWRECYGCE